MKNALTAPGWKTDESRNFWSTIASQDHIVQVYENDDVLMDSLEGFICAGLEADEGIVIIATKEHVEALGTRLSGKGIDLLKYFRKKQFILLDAVETLSQFMVVGWPDENKFNTAVDEILSKARGNKNRKVRAYGEMVALLWAQGYTGATIQLENIWNRYCAKEQLCLFCAYPKNGFTQDVDRSIDHICFCHNKVISGDRPSASEVHYREV
ncbi:MAG: MEDS domain-containing protein [Bacteroidia bacterium]|jgi:hypothetical protein